MVEFLINYKTTSEVFRESVSDPETLANVKDMTGQSWDDDKQEMTAYTENIEEISVDGVSSEGDDYEAFNDWLDANLGVFDPTIIRLMDEQDSDSETRRIEEVLEVTGGDIPSPTASLVIRNLFQNEYHLWYQKWREVTVKRAREELSLFELESTGQTGFIDSIFDLFGL